LGKKLLIPDIAHEHLTTTARLSVDHLCHHRRATGAVVGSFFTGSGRTPIILEISFGVLGLMIVVALAHYHETKADEWVEMDFPKEDE
jgi:hypothetical protein